MKQHIMDTELQNVGMRAMTVDTLRSIGRFGVAKVTQL
jgi:hypothetical protein